MLKAYFLRDINSIISSGLQLAVRPPYELPLSLIKSFILIIAITISQQEVTRGRAALQWSRSISISCSSCFLSMFKTSFTFFFFNRKLAKLCDWIDPIRNRLLLLLSQRCVNSPADYCSHYDT